MPAYEFICNNCNHKFEIILSYQDYDTTSVRCPACDGEDTQRVIRPIRIARAGDDRLEEMADPARLAGLEDNPKELGRMMRQMSQELGEDIGPEFDEVVDRLEKGQKPEDIERDLPDLGDLADD